MLQSYERPQMQRMGVVQVSEYDQDDDEMFILYVVTPESVAMGGVAKSVEDESICTCHDLQSAVAITEAWNAYHIKN